MKCARSNDARCAVRRQGRLTGVGCDGRVTRVIEQACPGIGANAIGHVANQVRGGHVAQRFGVRSQSIEQQHARAEQSHRQQQQRDQRFHQRESLCASAHGLQASRATSSSRTRPVWLITMARGGAMPCVSQIVRVPVLAPCASGQNLSGEREARTNTAGKLATLLGPDRFLSSRKALHAVAGAFPRQRQLPARSLRHSVAGRKDGSGAGLLQPASSSSVALRTAPARRAARMEGTATRQDGDDAEPEAQLDEGDARASSRCGMCGFCVPLFFATLQNVCICAASHCWPGSRVYFACANTGPRSDLSRELNQRASPRVAHRQRLRIAAAPQPSATSRPTRCWPVQPGLRVSKATIYNTLNLFAASGLIRQLSVGNDRCWFDSNTDAHYHFLISTAAGSWTSACATWSSQHLPEPPPGMQVDGIDLVISAAARTPEAAKREIVASFRGFELP